MVAFLPLYERIHLFYNENQIVELVQEETIDEDYNFLTFCSLFLYYTIVLLLYWFSMTVIILITSIPICIFLMFCL